MPKSNENEKKSKIKKPDAISWLLHSIKILLGDESIRRYIILHYNPTLKHQLDKDIKTFDAFVKPGKTRADKNKEIEKYLKYVIKLKKDIIIFTATNIQQHDQDMETHFQSYIVDNDKKCVYVIDPAFNKNKENFVGIYYAEVTHEVIKPFFEKNDYEVKFVRLTKPAQTTTDDVFCQSWSLLILLNLLNNNIYKDDLEFDIPSTKLDKYDILLQFYKTIFTHMPELRGNLKAEYEGSITDFGFDKEDKKELLSYDPYDLLMSMRKSNM